MDAATANVITKALDENWPMRVGRKLKRTIYLHDIHANDPMQDICIGIVDSEILAESIIRIWNDRLDLRAQVEALRDEAQRVQRLNEMSEEIGTDYAAAQDLGAAFAYDQMLDLIDGGSGAV